MKTLRYAIVTALTLFMIGLITGAATVQAQEEHTFITNAWGQQVCLGRWVPSTALGQSGTCEGQLVGVPQLTAISTRQSVERLDQLIAVLASIDLKLDISNEQLGRLIEETVKSRTTTGLPPAQVSEFLRETITKRFDTLPRGFLVNDFIMEEITRIKEDILKEVETHYATVPVK